MNFKPMVILLLLSSACYGQQHQHKGMMLDTSWIKGNILHQQWDSSALAAYAIDDNGKTTAIFTHYRVTEVFNINHRLTLIYRKVKYIGVTK